MMTLYGRSNFERLKFKIAIQESKNNRLVK
jgi:hypothetical protein